MNEVFNNNRSIICFDQLATPLQHTVDQSLYATLIQVGPGRLQNALEFLQRGIVLHLLVGFPLDVIPEVLDGVAVGGSCKIPRLQPDCVILLLFCVEADTNHKSARFLFTPFVIKCMISHQQCHQLSDTYN